MIDDLIKYRNVEAVWGSGKQTAPEWINLKVKKMSKKIDFLRSLREMNEEDIKAKIQEDELRLKKLRFGHAVSPLENPMNIRAVRKDIARLKTQLRIKQMNS